MICAFLFLIIKVNFRLSLHKLNGIERYKGVRMMTVSGRDYINRIDHLNNEVWINGAKIAGNISNHNAYKGVLKSKAAIYDLQLQPDYQDTLTYLCDKTNSCIGFSFRQPVYKRKSH
jgi:aromatic ring hydroxylase